jgi:hypothetical protein
MEKQGNIRTIGLFPGDVVLHYIDKELVIATPLKDAQVVLRNGSKKSLTYALKMTGFKLKKGGSWKKRSDGLSYHLLEVRSEVTNGKLNTRGNSTV